MLKEFKEFLMRGNIVELAVAVIIGGAFKAIIDSLVNDIISPIIAMVANTGDIGSSFIPFRFCSNRYRCFHRCNHQLRNRWRCIVLNH